MSSVVCPHCHTNVPLRARVCTGCHAEVEYGTPRLVLLILISVAAAVGITIGTSTHLVVGLAVFILLSVGLVNGCDKFFKDRVSFKRIYRTK